MTEMADNQKKENFFVRAGKSIALYAKATKSELKKVSWPTRKQLINNTLIVIACVVAVGIVIFALDTVFGFGFNALIGRKTTSNPSDYDFDINDILEMSTEDASINFDDAFDELATGLEIEATETVEATESVETASDAE